MVICKGLLKYVPVEKRDAIFYEYHNSPIGGHRGAGKTYNRIKQDFYCENLKQDVQRRIQQCLDKKISSSKDQTTYDYYRYSWKCFR